MTAYGTTKSAHRYAEPVVRHGGYTFAAGPNTDLCPPLSAPGQPKSVSSAAAIVREKHEAIRPFVAAVREADAALPGAEFRGEGAAAKSKHEQALGLYAERLDDLRRATADLAAALYQAKVGWVAALRAEQEKVARRAADLIGKVQADFDQLAELDMLARGVEQVHSHGGIGHIRLSAEDDIPLRLEQRQRARRRDRESLATMVASDPDSLVSALLARLGSPSGYGRASW